ncbi:MAG: plasmid pRiA4b ORF-3 family protein [Chloroflexales bacterium]|nr:plasmid pRiA4b ORF-3 family protein [Chloroflexales bacterium]
MSFAALPEVYQLRIRLCAISPLIWRRLLVRSDTSIAALHHFIQGAFGWTDSHLHRFIIHGKAYGIAYIGGITFTDNPHQVCLANFCVRPNERFLYEYNFHDLWRHEIRLEQILSFDPTQIYPLCTGGARAAPPESCGGPQAFLALRQHFSIFHIAERLVAVLTKDDEIDDPHAELETLRYWLAIDRFDRRAVNRQLRHAATFGGISGAIPEVSV